MLSRRTIAAIGIATLVAVIVGFLILQKSRHAVDDLEAAPAVPSTASEPETVPVEATFVGIEGLTITAAVQQARTVASEVVIERSERKFTITDQTPVLRLAQYPGESAVEEIPTRPSDIRPGERLLIHVPKDQQEAATAQAVRIYIAY